MTKDLETAIKGLREALDKAKLDSNCERYIGFGERILELVNEKDYQEAIFVASAFRYATINFWSGQPTLQISDYITATCNLLDKIEE